MSSSVTTPSVANDPSSIIIDKIELERFDGTRKVDINALVVALNIATDISNPSLYGNILIADSNDLLGKNASSLIGEEFITIFLRQPDQGANFPEKTFEYKFVVTKVDMEYMPEQSSGSVFRIELRSIDNFINSGSMRSKSYANTPTGIVKSILENELKTDRPLVNFEEADGLTAYAFVESKPFEKIAIVTAQTFSGREFVTSTFSFYESFEGYNFESIENIIQRNLQEDAKPIVYEYKSDVSADRDGKTSIISYSKPYRFNTIEKLSYGFANTKVVQYDLVEKRAIANNITIAQELKDRSPQSLNNVDTRNSMTFLDKVKELGNLTYLIPYASDAGHKGGALPVRYDYTDRALLFSSPYTLILNENSLSIRVYGTLHQDIGKRIEIKIMDNLPHTEIQAKREDEHLSGIYLISAISHEIRNTGGKYEFFTNISCFKESSLRSTSYYDNLYDKEQINIPALGGTGSTTNVRLNELFGGI